HDCSEGGLAVALAECCIAGKRGFRGAFVNLKGRKDAALFGETQSRIVLSIPPGHRPRLEKLGQKHRVILSLLGKVGGRRFTIPGYLNLPLEQIEQDWRGGATVPGK
ncbi:MAG: phosphoribosylformylglycinamidine synthase II, partial [Chloroflexi bacterium]|nr:phosphoribosylformylglycinamidine synthase II [Chloroflexota bacterium]